MALNKLDYKLNKLVLVLCTRQQTNTNHCFPRQIVAQSQHRLLYWLLVLPSRFSVYKIYVSFFQLTLLVSELSIHPCSRP